MAAAIAFLDVDHTLTRRSTGYRLALEASRRGLVRPAALAALPFVYVAYRVRRPGSLDFGRGSGALRGIPLARLEEAAASALESRIAPDLYPEGLALVAALKAAGSRVFLATSSFDVIIRPLAERLGADGFVASSLEVEGGLTTGRFAGRPAFGEAKLELVAAVAKREGTRLADCSFYSDSAHDLPLLLAVGEPVAVNPDRRLRREASRRGWKSLRFGV